MNGTLIASTARGDMHPLAYQGILATDCHHQLVSILRSRLGDAHVLLFAEPAFDPGRDIVDWYSPVQGTPVRLIDLPGDKQDRVRASLVKMAADILAQARQLKETGDNSRVLSGNIIELALQYPGDECIHLVGEQPVLVGWGFGPATSGAKPQDLSRLAPLTPPAAPRPQPPVSEPTPGPAATEPAVVPPPPSPAGRWPRWLGILLGLALLLLLAWLLWRGFQDRPPLAGPAGPAVTAPETPAPPSGDADLETELARTRQLRQERDALGETLARKAEQCQEPAATAPAVPAAPGATGRQNELQVPDDAAKGGDLGFLQGVWRCDSELSTPKDPVIVEYIFDAEGKGQISVKTADKICAAGVRASLDPSGTLRLESDATIPCSRGNPIEGQRVECVGKGAQTSCQGVNVTSKGNWKARFLKF
jgi:hypothetical protein